MIKYGLVSILIVLDDTLVHTKDFVDKKGIHRSLNPYCAGRYSSTNLTSFQTMKSWKVSILIVLDDTLVQHK